MNQPLETSLVDKAIVFAVNAHRGTRRRGKEFPYIVHPLEALAIVATVTPDPEILAAAVLHDTIEDTETTYEELVAEFGERVARLVAEETDVRSTPDGTQLTWRQRKQRDMDNLKAAPRDVKIVAIGDKLSNMRAIARDYRVMGDELWKMFHEKDKATHAWRYRGLRSALSELNGTEAYREFDTLVTEVFDS